MKMFTQVLIVLYGLIALYYSYLAVLQLFVYVANKTSGHEESFAEAGKALGIAAFLVGLAVGSYFISKQAAVAKPLLFIVYLPITALVLYGLWAILLVISSGGKWN